MIKELKLGKISDNYTFEEFKEIFNDFSKIPTEDPCGINGIFRTDIHIPADDFIQFYDLAPEFDWETTEGLAEGMEYITNELGVKFGYKYGEFPEEKPDNPEDVYLDYHDVDPELLYRCVMNRLSDILETPIPLVLLMAHLNEIKSIITNFKGDQVITFSCDSLPLQLNWYLNIMWEWADVLHELNYSVAFKESDELLRSIYNDTEVLAQLHDSGEAFGYCKDDDEDDEEDDDSFAEAS